MSSGMTPFNSRTNPPKGGSRKIPQRSTGRFTSNTSRKLKMELAPVAEAVAVQLLRICERQLTHPQQCVAWRFPQRGYRKEATRQLVQLALNKRIVKGRSKNMTERIAKMASELIVHNRLVVGELVDRVNDAKMSLRLSVDGLAFLDGMSIGEIIDRRSKEQSVGDREAHVRSLARARAGLAKHPSVHQPTGSKKESAA